MNKLTDSSTCIVVCHIVSILWKVSFKKIKNKKKYSKCQHITTGDILYTKSRSVQICKRMDAVVYEIKFPKGNFASKAVVYEISLCESGSLHNHTTEVAFACMYSHLNADSYVSDSHKSYQS